MSIHTITDIPSAQGLSASIKKDPPNKVKGLRAKIYNGRTSPNPIRGLTGRVKRSNPECEVQAKVEYAAKDVNNTRKKSIDSNSSWGSGNKKVHDSDPDDNISEVSNDSEIDEFVFEKIEEGDYYPEITLFLKTSTGYHHKIALGQEEQKRMNILHGKAKDLFNLDPQYKGEVKAVLINFHLSLATLEMNDGTKKHILLNETILSENYKDINPNKDSQLILEERKKTYLDSIKDILYLKEQCTTDLLHNGFTINNSFPIKGHAPRGGNKGENALSTIPSTLKDKCFEQTTSKGYLMPSITKKADLFTLSTQFSLLKHLIPDDRYDTFMRHHIDSIKTEDAKKKACQALYEMSIFYPALKKEIKTKLENTTGPIPSTLDPLAKKRLEHYYDQLEDKVDRYALYLATIAHSVASDDLSDKGIKTRYDHIVETFYNTLLSEQKENPKPPTLAEFKTSTNDTHRELLNYAFEIASLGTSSSAYLAACAELHFAPKQDHVNGILFKAYTDCKRALPKPNPSQDPWISLTQDAFEFAISKKEVEQFEGSTIQEKFKNALIASAEEHKDPSTGIVSAIRNWWKK